MSYKKLVTNVEWHASAVSWLESGEQCYVKVINASSQYHPFKPCTGHVLLLLLQVSDPFPLLHLSLLAYRYKTGSRGVTLLDQLTWETSHQSLAVLPPAQTWFSNTNTKTWLQLGYCWHHILRKTVNIVIYLTIKTTCYLLILLVQQWHSFHQVEIHRWAQPHLSMTVGDTAQHQQVVQQVIYTLLYLSSHIHRWVQSHCLWLWHSPAPAGCTTGDLHPPVPVITHT